MLVIVVVSVDVAVNDLFFKTHGDGSQIWIPTVSFFFITVDGEAVGPALCKIILENLWATAKDISALGAAQRTKKSLGVIDVHRCSSPQNVVGQNPSRFWVQKWYIFFWECLSLRFISSKFGSWTHIFGRSFWLQMWIYRIAKIAAKRVRCEYHGNNDWNIIIYMGVVAYNTPMGVLAWWCGYITYNMLILAYP